MQEIVELLVFALIALLIGTGVVWLAGWLLGLVGTLLTWLAGLVWSLLRFVVPIALVAGVVYLLVRLMNRSAEKVARDPASPGSPQPGPGSGATMSQGPVAAPSSPPPDAPSATETGTTQGATTAAASAAQTSRTDPASPGTEPSAHTGERERPRAPGDAQGEGFEARPDGTTPAARPDQGTDAEPSPDEAHRRTPDPGAAGPPDDAPSTGPDPEEAGGPQERRNEPDGHEDDSEEDPRSGGPTGA